MATNLEDRIQEAAASGDIKQLSRLIQTADPLPDRTVQSLLRKAATTSQPFIIKFLIEQFPSIPLDEETIRAAVYSGSIPVFSALLAKDPSAVKMQFDMRGTPLIIACMAKKPIDFLRFLLEAGADPNQDPDAAAFPLALVAAFYVDIEVINLLLEYGAKIEHSGALSTAAQFNNEAMIRHLLHCGAKPETDAAERLPFQSPLNVAIRKGNIEALKILLDSGADITLVDAKGLDARATAEEMERKRGNNITKILHLLETFKK